MRDEGEEGAEFHWSVIVFFRQPEQTKLLSFVLSILYIFTAMFSSF